MIENVGFDYLLKRTKRKTLGVEVNYKGEVIVTAPDYIPFYKIEEVLYKRKGWIIQKIEEKSSVFNILPRRQFISGESIYLFGKQYYLKIEKSLNFHVEKQLHRITFYVNDYNGASEVVNDWLVKELELNVNPLWKKCLRNFLKKYSLSIIPDYKLRTMSKRWGSCTEKGTIHLNTCLVSAPVECIEYVIYHELVHFIAASHDEFFYEVLESFLPEYQEIKKRLDNNTVLFVND